jgi:anti-anti-sigma regulatory factor
MSITQRQATIGVFILQIAAALAALIYLHFFDADPVTEWTLLTTLPIVLALLLSYRRGWEPARYLNLILVTAAIAGPVISPITSTSFSPATVIPPALALIVANHYWVIGTASIVIFTLTLRAGGQGVYAQGDHLIAFALSIGFIVVARLIFDTARRTAETHARQAEQERRRADERAAESMQQAELLATRNAEQQRLLELVSTLETPAIRLADHVLLAPVVGYVDADRLARLSSSLLAEVHSRRIRLVILDIAGMAGFDNQVSTALINLVQSLRLIGTRVIMSGISSTLAHSLASQQLHFENISVVSSPQEALSMYNSASTALFHG